MVEGFRWALLGSNPPGRLRLVSVVVVIVILIGGLYSFRRIARRRRLRTLYDVATFERLPQVGAKGWDVPDRSVRDGDR